MCGAPHDGAHSVTVSALLPGSRKVLPRQSMPVTDGTRGKCGSCAGLPGKGAERFGMGPAVVLGQDLTEAAGPSTTQCGGRCRNG